MGAGGRIAHAPNGPVRRYERRVPALAHPHVLPDQLLPDHEFPLQLFPLQLLPDQELPDQEFPLQLLPDHEFPFHVPPDQLLPARHSAAQVAEANVAPKMSTSPLSSTSSITR